MTALRSPVSKAANASGEQGGSCAADIVRPAFGSRPTSLPPPTAQARERLDASAHLRWPEPILTDGRVRSRARGLHGEDIQILIHSDQVGGRFSLIHHFVAAGHWSLLQRFEGCDLLLTMLEGEVELACDGETLLLPLHASVAIARDSYFGWHNIGEGEARIAVTYFQGGHEQLLRAASNCTNTAELRYIARTFGVHLASRVRPLPQINPGNASPAC